MPISNRSPSGAVIDFSGATDAEMMPYVILLADMVRRETARPFQLAKRYKKAQIAKTHAKAPPRSALRFQESEGNLKSHLIAHQSATLAAEQEARDYDFVSSSSSTPDSLSSGVAAAGGPKFTQHMHDWVLESGEKNAMQALSKLTKTQNKKIKEEEKNTKILCVACMEKVKRIYIERDHSTSSDAIGNNEEDLLSFLNLPGNRRFAELLLEQSGMEELFVKKSVSLVEITDYAAQSSYNAKLNLWPLCRSCNLEKSNTPSLDWMEKTTYLAPIAESLREKRHAVLNGVLIPCVYENLPARAPSLVIGGQEVLLFSSVVRCSSLPDYMMKGVLAMHPKVVATVEAEESRRDAFRVELEDTARTPDPAERKEKGVHHRRRMKRAEAYSEGVRKAQEERREARSSGERSNSNSPETEKRFASLAEESAYNQVQIESIIKGINELLKKGGVSSQDVAKLFKLLGKLPQVQLDTWIVLKQDIDQVLKEPTPGLSVLEDLAGLFREHAPQKPERKRVRVSQKQGGEPVSVVSDQGGPPLTKGP